MIVVFFGWFVVMNFLFLLVLGMVLGSEDRVGSVSETPGQFNASASELAQRP